MKRFFWIWFPVLVVAIILLFKEWSVLVQINEVLFGDFHDAIKNYYTVLYHVKWDTSYSHFEGMNFPYGEHVLFTDNQPLLSGILRLIEQSGFEISRYIPGILNSLMLFSFLLCAWFCNQVLRRLGTIPWFAAMVSIGLVFLSPQLNRIQRHFALSYSFIIPMLIFLAILHMDRKRWNRSWLMALIVVAIAFTHAYYLGFALLIFGCLFLFESFKSPQQLKSHLGHFALHAIIPFLVVQLIMIFTDTVTDRPSYPWSPFLGNFIPHGFIINYDNPASVWYSKTTGMRYVDWEAKAYLGIYTIGFLLAGILVSLISRIRIKSLVIKESILNRKMYFLLFIACSAIVVSLTYSLLSGNTDLYQLMGPLRQFRAVGRFYWISFFAFNFVSFGWLSYWFTQCRSPLKAIPILIALFLLTFDAFHASKKTYHRIHHQPLFISGSDAQLRMQNQLMHVDVLLPLPYFHIGSEDFAITTNRSRHYKNCMTVSYASGKPMTGNVLSRTSLQQTLEFLNYRYWPVGFPIFLDHLKSKKVAMLIDKKAELSPHETLLSQAGMDTLVETDEYLITGFDQDKYRELQARQDSLKQYFKESPSGVWKYYNYEESEVVSFSGKGSKIVAIEEPRLVESIALPANYKGSLKLGMWVYLNQATKASEGFVIEFMDGNQIIKKSDRRVIRNKLKAVSGEWGYIEMVFPIPYNCTEVILTQTRNRLHPSPTHIDNLRVSLIP